VKFPRKNVEKNGSVFVYNFGPNQQLVDRSTLNMIPI
jgi:hypothetical protein